MKSFSLYRQVSGIKMRLEATKQAHVFQLKGNKSDPFSDCHEVVVIWPIKLVSFCLCSPIDGATVALT
jgi:hypothetical protein